MNQEQQAKWAAEKRERELAAIYAREAERETEKLRMNKRAAAVDVSAFGQHFTTDEKDAIKQYYLSGDWRGANAEGREAAVSVIERALRATGVEIEHVSLSDGDGGEGKSIYAKVGGDVVRISDHELPQTARRDNDRANGLSGKWDREVIVTDWQSTPLDDYLGEIKGEDAASVEDSLGATSEPQQVGALMQAIMGNGAERAEAIDALAAPPNGALNNSRQAEPKPQRSARRGVDLGL